MYKTPKLRLSSVQNNVIKNGRLFQILTNDDEVENWSLSSLLLAVILALECKILYIK